MAVPFMVVEAPLTLQNTYLGDEQALEFIRDDKSVEITPQSIRRREQIIEQVGLDADEIAFLTATKIQNIPQRNVSEVLGWTRAKAERVRRRIDRRLKRIREGGPALPVRSETRADGGCSLMPAYQERLDSGRRVWALSHSNIELCPQMPIYREAILKGAPMQEDLQSQLRAEYAKLDKFIVQSQGIDDEVRKLEAAVDQLKEASNEVLLSADYPGRLMAAERLVVEAGARRRAFQIVVDRQRVAIETIGAQIAAGRKAAFLSEVAEPERNLKEALEAFLAAHKAYSEVISKHWEVAQRHVLFPPPSADSDDTLRHFQERMAAQGLCYAAGNLWARRERNALPGYRWRAA